LVAAWAALLRLHAHLVAAIDADMQRDVGLPLSWYDVLLELNAAPAQRLRMLELADRVVLSRTRVTRVVDELTKVGLVVRKPNPQDGRSSFAELTTRGDTVFRQAAPVYLGSIRRHFGGRVTDPAALRLTLEAALQRTAD
jgi:DNA-binding MarR family transcriptional regulator